MLLVVSGIGRCDLQPTISCLTDRCWPSTVDAVWSSLDVHRSPQTNSGWMLMVEWEPKEAIGWLERCSLASTHRWTCIFTLLFHLNYQQCFHQREKEELGVQSSSWVNQWESCRWNRFILNYQMNSSDSEEFQTSQSTTWQGRLKSHRPSIEFYW